MVLKIDYKPVYLDLKKTNYNYEYNFNFYFLGIKNINNYYEDVLVYLYDANYSNELKVSANDIIVNRNFMGEGGTLKFKNTLNLTPYSYLMIKRDTSTFQNSAYKHENFNTIKLEADFDRIYLILQENLFEMKSKKSFKFIENSNIDLEQAIVEGTNDVEYFKFIKNSYGKYIATMGQLEVATTTILGIMKYATDTEALVLKNGTNVAMSVLQSWTILNEAKAAIEAKYDAYNTLNDTNILQIKGDITTINNTLTNILNDLNTSLPALLLTKQNLSERSNAIDSSTDRYPTNYAVKSYVDNRIASLPDSMLPPISMTLESLIDTVNKPVGTQWKVQNMDITKPGYEGLVWIDSNLAVQRFIDTRNSADNVTIEESIDNIFSVKTSWLDLFIRGYNYLTKNLFDILKGRVDKVFADDPDAEINFEQKHTFYTASPSPEAKLLLNAPNGIKQLTNLSVLNSMQASSPGYSNVGDETERIAGSVGVDGLLPFNFAFKHGDLIPNSNTPIEATQILAEVQNGRIPATTDINIWEEGLMWYWDGNTNKSLANFKTPKYYDGQFVPCVDEDEAKEKSLKRGDVFFYVADNP